MRSTVQVLAVQSLLLSALLVCDDEPIPLNGACDNRPLEALKANADGFRQFYTDPEESVGYFNEDRSISDVAVGGTL